MVSDVRVESGASPNASRMAANAGIIVSMAKAAQPDRAATIRMNSR